MSRNPITKIRVAGEPFAIGHALGQASADALTSRVFATEEYQALNARWRGSDYLGQLEAAARAAYPAYVKEIEGLAAGAGQDFETIFLWNCRGDLRLPDGVSRATAEAAASGCTSIMIPAEGDGPAVIAHNEDGAREFLGVCLWVDCQPDGEGSWSSFMYPGMLPGHTFGVNGAGVVQTINNIRAEDLAPGIPRQVICRAVLGCAGLDDAIEILRRPGRASGFHHNLGEAGSRRLVSVEAPASGCNVQPVTTPMAHANHLLAPAFERLSQTVTRSSRARQDAADRMIGEGVLGSGSAEDILFDTATPIHCDSDKRDDYAQTLATGVFSLQADRVDWKIHATPGERDALSGSLPLA